MAVFYNISPGDGINELVLHVLMIEFIASGGFPFPIPPFTALPLIYFNSYFIALNKPNVSVNRSFSHSFDITNLLPFWQHLSLPKLSYGIPLFTPNYYLYDYFCYLGQSWDFVGAETPT